MGFYRNAGKSAWRIGKKLYGGKRLSKKDWGFLNKAAISAAAAATEYANTAYSTAAKPVNSKPKSKRPNRTKARSLTVMKARARGGPANRRASTRSRYGATESKSGGFFTAGTAQYDLFDKHAKTGVVVAREDGGVISLLANEITAYLGHNTIQRQPLAQDVCRAIIRFVAQKLGRNFSDWSDTASTMNFNVFFRYRLHANGTTQAISVASNTGVNSKSWGTIANDLWAQFQNNMLTTPGTIGPEFHFINMSIFLQVDTTDPNTYPNLFREYDMKDATVDIHCKSSLKIQNRTINSAGADEDNDVDNVPLYGKHYEGTGGYIQWAGRGLVNESQPLVIGPNQVSTDLGTSHTPIIWRAAPSSRWVEPPKLSMIRGAKAIGKAHLDPGQVKTSNLTFTKTMNINTLFRALGKYLIPIGAGSNNTEMCPLGNFRIFCFEKMIQAVATTTTNSIKLAFEQDHKIGITFHANNPPVLSFITSHNPV